MWSAAAPTLDGIQSGAIHNTLSTMEAEYQPVGGLWEQAKQITHTAQRSKAGNGTQLPTLASTPTPKHTRHLLDDNSTGNSAEAALPRRHAYPTLLSQAPSTTAVDAKENQAICPANPLCTQAATQELFSIIIIKVASTMQQAAPHDMLVSRATTPPALVTATIARNGMTPYRAKCWQLPLFGVLHDDTLLHKERRMS